MDTALFPAFYDVENEVRGIAYLDNDIVLISTKDRTIAVQHNAVNIRRMLDQPYRYGSDIPLYTFNRTVYGLSIAEGQLWTLGVDAGRLRSDITPIGDQVPLFPSWLQEWFKINVITKTTIEQIRLRIIGDVLFLALNAFTSDLSAGTTNILQPGLSALGHQWFQLYFYKNWGMWALHYGSTTGNIALLDIQPGPHGVPIAHDQEHFIMVEAGSEQDDAIRHSGNYTSVADVGSGGLIRVTTASVHGLLAANTVTLTGGYAGTYTIQNVSDTTHFDIVAVYGSTSTGTYYQGTNNNSITSIIEVPAKYVSQQITSQGLLLGFPVRIVMESLYLQIEKAKTNAISAALSITPYNDNVAQTALTKTAITGDGMIYGWASGFSDSYVIKVTDASSGTLRLSGIEMGFVDRGGRVQ